MADGKQLADYHVPPVGVINTDFLLMV